MSHEPENVEETIAGIEHLADEKDKVCIADVIDEFGGRSFGPFLLIFALIDISPIGGIPGLPTFLAALCILIAAQMLFGRDHLWIPGFVENRAIGAKKLRKSVEKLEGIAKKLDHWFKGRWRRFTGPMWQKIAAVAIILLACTVPPLELLPFATTAPMSAIAAFGLALTVRDGLLMLIACSLSVLSIGLGIYFYMTEVASGGGGGMGLF